eukprot:symbB.v1.2.026686.t1/scaffold2689.1/size72939/1
MQYRAVRKPPICFVSSPAGKSLVPLAREDARLDPFLGCTIRKIFGSQWYHGQVIAIDVDVASGDRAYHIAYEDGDEEHLSSFEVKNFLVMASRSAPPSEAGSPRRSVVPSHRPSIARTEVSAPRPSVAPSISQPAAFLGAAAAPQMPSFTGISTGKSSRITFWGPMLLAGITGAMMVALVSSFMSFIMDGELDGGETRGPIPMGLVAPLPPWAEAETQIFAKVGPSGGGNGPMVEDVNLLSLKDDFFQEKIPEVLNEPQSFQPVEKILEDGQQSSTTSFSEAFGDHKVEEIPIPQMPPTEAEDVEDETHRDVPGNQLIDNQMALEEDLSVAVAAVMEASGLVVRVVAKSFFRSLEEVWLSILSSFSSSLGASFTGSPEPEIVEPPSPPTPEPEEAAGALQSLMTTILVSLAGVEALRKVCFKGAVLAWTSHPLRSMLKINVALPDGHAELLTLLPSSTLQELKTAAQQAFGKMHLRLVTAKNRVLVNFEQTLEEAEIEDGECLTALVLLQPQLAATEGAFALWCHGDSMIVTWGDAYRGGDSSAVQDQLRGVQQIQATGGAFAAILEDGSIVTWGRANEGGD